MSRNLCLFVMILTAALAMSAGCSSHYSARCIKTEECDGRLVCVAGACLPEDGDLESEAASEADSEFDDDRILGEKEVDINSEVDRERDVEPPSEAESEDDRAESDSMVESDSEEAACTNGETRCSSNVKAKTCTKGAWTLTQDCSLSGQHCEAGACVKLVATSIVTGGSHSCALLQKGEMYCWGSNFSGQLGIGKLGLPISTPTLVSAFPEGVKSIAIGDIHSCAVTKSGAAYCWGNNGNGQIGDGTTTWRFSPVKVSGLGSGVKSIVAGAGNTCALMETGAVYCWGYNQFGAVGDGTSEEIRPSPILVGGLPSPIVSLSVGDGHICALLDTGRPYSWGENCAGQLGTTTTDRCNKGNDPCSTTPIAVSAPDHQTSRFLQSALPSRSASCAFFYYPHNIAASECPCFLRVTRQPQ